MKLKKVKKLTFEKKFSLYKLCVAAKCELRDIRIKIQKKINKFS